MAEAKIKSRTFRRIKVKLPGNRVTVHYRKRKPRQAICAGCGAVLHGVPRERPYKMRNLPKTMKRPERPYGGVLCSECTRKVMIEKARSGK